jgi:hypothetical protein
MQEISRAIVAGELEALAEASRPKREPFMPSKTEKQKRTMAAAAHNPAFAKKLGIPQKVAKDFNRADSRKRK